MKNWNGEEVENATSRGGVTALANPYHNLVSTGIRPWPPPEVVQKLYKSRQRRAFSGEELQMATKFLSYYSDLQSIHSEDAITWSVFGTVAHAIPAIRKQYVRDLFLKFGIDDQDIVHSEISLWRRIPHPDTLVSGGPEIDFGIHTDRAVVLGEAKWRSSVGAKQGKNKDKDQIQLRVEFLNKYAEKIYPLAEKLIVLGVGIHDDVTDTCQKGNVQCIGVTWDEICSIESHPHSDEVRQYLAWKKEHSKR
jgi:hypothetical protein